MKEGDADRDLKDGSILTREWFDFASDRVPQMQEKELQSRLLVHQQLSFVEGEEQIEDAAQKSVQRPRVFYRREADPNPLVVASVR